MKIAGIALAVVVVLIGACTVALRSGDGPTGPIQGGRLTTGPLVPASDVDWSSVVTDPMVEVELQLWIAKGWHEDAVRDGRVVLRFDGKRYEGQAVRVTDPELLPQLRARSEGSAAEFLGSLLPLKPDTDAIWFFRVDPRERS